MIQFYEVIGIGLDGEYDHAIAFDSLDEAIAHFRSEAQRSGYSSLTLATRFR